MHDARDAEDIRLLEAKRHGELLAAYWDVIRDRLRLRLPEREASEIASDVAERLLSELARGRTYPVLPRGRAQGDRLEAEGALRHVGKIGAFALVAPGGVRARGERQRFEKTRVRSTGHVAPPDRQPPRARCIVRSGCGIDDFLTCAFPTTAFNFHRPI